MTRVLYAIENGGFSGAYMPQNIVVGQDAIDVAKFVATYAGRLAPQVTGVQRCQTQSIGTLPVASASPISPTSTTTSATSSATTAAAPVTKPHGKGKAAKGKHKRAHA